MFHVFAEILLFLQKNYPTMIKSMTGFGKAEALLNHRKITVELRSLNSKQLDLSVKMPNIYRSLEFEVRNRVTRALQRGKVDLFVTVESAATETASRINAGALAAYLDQMRACAPQLGIDVASPANEAAILQALMRMPDVVTAADMTVTKEESEALLRAVDEAIARIDAFRTQEGAILIADLLKRVDLIEHYKEEVTPYEEARIETIRNRMRESLDQLHIEVDRNRFEQEMIFYLEKLDVTEEKVRLTNHCRYFREVAATEEAPGRKLGFIAQEMGREINTLGSKSNEASMQVLVVKMKDELEKIKEQVLNIL